MIKFNLLEAGASENKPRMIVVHAMGEFILDKHPIHASDFLPKYGLSAHVLVEPEGDLIICREEDQGAYHARGFNTDSLGIEFLVQGHHNYASFIEAIKSPYVLPEQWEAGIAHVRHWVNKYDIHRSKVVRHSDISPGRKVDPGAGFQWDRFLDEVFT